MKRFIYLTCLFLFSFIVSMPLAAQLTPTVISVGVPEEMIPFLNQSEIFAAFYETNPDVSVVFVPFAQNIPLVESVVENPTQHLNDLERIAATADIVYIANFELSIAGTRAHYFLDLAPLVNSDTEIDANNYYPPAWNAYHWNQGIWALPVQFSLQFLIYDEQAFTEANLNFPTGDWTLDDLLNAANMLQSATVFEPALLLRAAYGQSLTTEDGIPNFATPEMADALFQAVALQNYPSAQPTLIIGDMGALVAPPNEAQKRGAPLPGNIVGSRTSGLAVSAGTATPELAYQIARYLTSEPRFVGLGGGIPANRTVAQQLNSFPISNSLFGRPIDAATQSFLQSALETAIPASEFKFGEYLLSAAFSTSDVDSTLNALTREQETAIETLAMAESRSANTVLVIPTPIPTPALQGDEVELLFDVLAGGLNLTKQGLLDSALQNFAAADPQIGRVTQPQPSTNSLFPQRDCFIQTLSAMDINAFVGLIPTLPVNPLLDSDPNFSRQDFLGGVLEQLSVDGQVLGLPLTIIPIPLRYDLGKLVDAGVTPPDSGWDTNTLEAVLQQLNDHGDRIMEAPPNVINILLLAASYGGLAISVDNSNITFNLTTPETIAAIREVLDLAKEGLMEYRALSSSEPYDITFGIGGPAIYFSGGSFSEVTIRDIPYPVGSSYAPVAFDTVGFFMSADSLYPEACYRLYTFLRENYELLNGIPAFRPSLTDSNLSALIGQDILNTYNLFAAQLDAANAVILPTRLTSSINFSGAYPEGWIAQAFDAYVLEDADLDTLLAEAQSRIDGFNACLTEIEPFNFTPTTTQEEFQHYQENIQACATAVDPSLSTNMGQ